MKNILFFIFLLSLFSCQKENNLSKMNNVIMPDFEELKHLTNSDDTIKILIIGNSITSHEIASDIGWNHKSGMAATSINKDYVHLFFNQLVSNNSSKNILLRLANYSQFERNPNETDINSKKFTECYKFNPNIIIYQLGDNVEFSNQNSFTLKSVQFLNNFKNSEKLILSPFVQTPDNYSLNKNLSFLTHSSFIDISSISNDDKNRAYTTPDKSWKAEGIGQHPNNVGMLKISNSIFTALKH